MRNKVVPFKSRTPKVQLPANTKIWNLGSVNVVLTKGEDNLWRDRTGCVYALADEDSSVDKETRAGIGPFSMPEGSPINSAPAVAKHDFQYSCPAYQQTHTRQEADTELREGIAKMKTWHKVLAWPFYILARLFGHLFWENSKTNV